MRKVQISYGDNKVFADSYLYYKGTGDVNNIVYCSLVGLKFYVECALSDIRRIEKEQALLIEAPQGTDTFIQVSNNVEKYRAWHTKTPGDKCHGIYLLEDAVFQTISPLGFYLIGDTEEECRSKFFQYLSRYSCPLYPAWSDKLWKMLDKDLKWITPLTGYNKVGYKVLIDEVRLVQEVSKKIASGKFTVPEKAWKEASHGEKHRPDTQAKQDGCRAL